MNQSNDQKFSVNCNFMILSTESELRSKKFCILIILDLLRKINDNTIEFVKREKNVDTEENNTKFNNNIRLMWFNIYYLWEEKHKV